MNILAQVYEIQLKNKYPFTAPKKKKLIIQPVSLKKLDP